MATVKHDEDEDTPHSNTQGGPPRIVDVPLQDDQRRLSHDGDATRKRSLTDRDYHYDAFNDDLDDEDDDDGVNHEDDEEDDDEEAAKRRRLSRKKANPPPKKLNNEQWDFMFDRLVEYKNLHGDCLVPKRYTADPKLGTWVETQRVQYKKLQRSHDEGEPVTPNKRLNSERLQRLESIGFAWSAKNVRKVKSPTTAPNSTLKPKKAGNGTDAASRAASRQRLNDAQWQEMYDRLVEYKNKYGDCLVPKKYEEDPKLATWVETQRVFYNRDYRPKSKGDGGNAPDSPSDHHSEHPDDPALLSLPTAPPVEAKTPEEWAEEMDRTDGVVATPEDAAEIAATMAEAAMEVINQVTDTNESKESMGVAAFDTPFVNEPTDANMKEDDDTDIAAEAADVEAANMEGMTEEEVAAAKIGGKRLTPDRKDRLDELGFVWSLRTKRVDDHWDDMYRQLVQYKDKHGDCLVPSRYEENFKLGKWVETQRYEYTKLQRAIEQNDLTSKDEIEASKSRPTNPRLTEERRSRLEAIGFEWKVKHKMKRYYDRQWDAMFHKLLKFKDQNGHCLVPKRYPPDIKLGTWVHTQRIQYRKFLAGTSKKEDGSDAEEIDDDSSKGDSSKGDDEHSFRLTEDRRKRLEEAGFIWSARETEKTSEPSRITRNSYDDQWDAMFERLKAYKDRHGDCLVPKRCKEDQKLGTWVDTQRVQYKKMRKHLAQQGMSWETPIKSEGDSELNEANRDCDNESLSEASHEGSSTGNTTPKPIVGRLTDERISRLEGLGFVWSLRDDWQKHYEELTAYKKEHGNCNVPARYAKNRRLGIWVSAQRQQYKIMKMSDDLRPRRSAPLTLARITLLNELDFTWTIRSRDSLGESWNQRLEELKVYKNEHGNCLVPSRYPPNPELGVWVGTQRTQYRLYMKAKEAGKTTMLSSGMNDDRIAQLEELGFIWALRGGSDNVWRKRISELVEYRNVHGNTAVPLNYKQNLRLGSWASAQRAQYRLMQEGKPSSLDEEKVAELDTLEFFWDEPALGENIEPQGIDSSQIVAAAEDAIQVAEALAASSAYRDVPIELGTEADASVVPMDLVGGDDVVIL